MDGHVLNGAFYSLPYDVLNDVAPISPLVRAPFYARKTMPANDLNELIAWLKTNPNKASAGIATAVYRLAVELALRFGNRNWGVSPASQSRFERLTN